MDAAGFRTSLEEDGENHLGRNCVLSVGHRRCFIRLDDDPVWVLARHVAPDGNGLDLVGVGVSRLSGGGTGIGQGLGPGVGHQTRQGGLALVGPATENLVAIYGFGVLRRDVPLQGDEAVNYGAGEVGGSLWAWTAQGMISRSVARRREVVMTYPPNRGGGVNICASPPCTADLSATCRATAGSVVPSAASAAWTGLSSAK